MNAKYLWNINLFTFTLFITFWREPVSQWTCCVGDDLKIFEQTHGGGFLWRFWKEILTWKHLQWLFDRLTLNKSDVILLNNDSKLVKPGCVWYHIIPDIPPGERKLLLVWRGLRNIKTKLQSDCQTARSIHHKTSDRHNPWTRLVGSELRPQWSKSQLSNK